MGKMTWIDDGPVWIGSKPYDLDLSTDQLLSVLRRPYTDELSIVARPLSDSALNDLHQQAINGGTESRKLYLQLCQCFACLSVERAWSPDMLSIVYCYPVSTPDITEIVRTVQGGLFVRCGSDELLSGPEYHLRFGMTVYEVLQEREREIAHEFKDLEDELCRVQQAQKVVRARVSPAQIQTVQRDELVALVDWAVIEGLPTNWWCLPVGLSRENVVSTTQGGS